MKHLIETCARPYDTSCGRSEVTRTQPVTWRLLSRGGRDPNAYYVSQWARALENFELCKSFLVRCCFSSSRNRRLGMTRRADKTSPGRGGRRGGRSVRFIISETSVQFINRTLTVMYLIRARK